MSFYMINLFCVAFSAFTAGFFKNNCFALVTNLAACLLNILVVSSHLN